ncbi:Hypothetical predicted protein [Paramuricea clavata]|uniref:Uncharacterized protein n=1 Tax=Paramuricea clavata TaxID=317549 RepID=A0A7D9I1A3_PARCT|nr:Hypothetical predicted protein [Paramuricea clavata]
MPLPTLLDAENKELFMRVLNFSYPLTIENVQNEQCGVQLFMFFPTMSDSGIEINFKTDMMYLPPGSYTLQKLLDTLNTFVAEYDVNFTILNNNRVGVTYNIEREYWHSDETVKRILTKPPHQIFEVFSQNTNEGDEFQMVFTESLEYMLSLRELKVHPDVEETKAELLKGSYFFPTRIGDTLSWYNFMNKANARGNNKFACSFMGKALPDISNGIDKMFVYCEQLEMSVVGDTYAPLLAIIPLNGSDRGSGALCTYTPPSTRRRLIKSKIDQFKVTIYDTTHTLIPFSSGTNKKKMLKIELEVKSDRPKELVPVKYEYSSEVKAQLSHKLMYYTVAHVTGLLGGYKLSVARKWDVTSKLTGAEIPATGGGFFYGGKDYATWRGKTVRHCYTLKRYLLFERFEQISNNSIIIPVSNSTVKAPLPNCLLTVRNVADLDENVKFIFERTPGYDGDSFALAANGKASTVEERAAGKICPPPQLNPNYAPDPKIQKVGKIQSRVPKQQQQQRAPRAGIALGMALPMLLNTGTSVVGSIFGKKSAGRPTPSVNNQGGNRQSPAWMDAAPPRRRRRRPQRYYDDDYY